jgi:hypothetical protein
MPRPPSFAKNQGRGSPPNPRGKPALLLTRQACHHPPPVDGPIEHGTNERVPKHILWHTSEAPEVTRRIKHLQMATKHYFDTG